MPATREPEEGNTTVDHVLGVVLAGVAGTRKGGPRGVGGTLLKFWWGLAYRGETTNMTPKCEL